ncbi:MAG: PepSY-associated TM helix domain-containing protein [Ignavibacteria bacterium]|nr:PepSY-associated TM helix domain-containing protein [Ignavibacteria bacterium]
MAFKWRKWNRAVHRDFGYLFFGLTIVYALSGIAINHRSEWNPNFIIVQKSIDETPFKQQPTKEEVLAMLEKYGVDGEYRKHYYPSPERLKIFLTGGSAEVNLETGSGYVELTKRRSVFREINYLHYNPTNHWTWVSDIFAGALIILALSGLLIPRGADGITARGAWLTLVGIIIPMIFVIIYLY